jgi:hypothetical protein
LVAFPWPPTTLRRLVEALRWLKANLNDFELHFCGLRGRQTSRYLVAAGGE